MPPAITTPPRNVEDADEEVTLIKLAVMPPVKVEVELLVSSIEPPVMVNPLLVKSPPPATTSPPLVKVEVAELVFKILPPVRVRPLADARPPVFNTASPPEKVEVAVVDAILREPENVDVPMPVAMMLVVP